MVRTPPSLKLYSKISADAGLASVIPAAAAKTAALRVCLDIWLTPGVKIDPRSGAINRQTKRDV